MLVCSAGGHLEQLLRLRPLWSQRKRVWVVLDKPDARARLEGERVIWAHGPTNRRPDKLAKNAWLALRLLLRERPTVLLSNGAGVALPFFVAARALGIPSVFMEVVDRVETASLTGRLCRPFATKIVLQNERQRSAYPEGLVLGPLW